MGSRISSFWRSERTMNPTSQLDTAGQGAMYGGAAATGIFWGLSVSDVAVIMSMVVAVLGFLVHAWATVRKDRREMERHKALMASGVVTHAQLETIQARNERVDEA